MSAAATTADPPQPSRSGRLLSLVRQLIDYGRHLAATLRQRAVPADPPGLARAFGTSDLTLILARVAQGLYRAGLLEEKIAGAAARLDAEPQPEAAPSPRARRAREVQPPPPRQPQAPPTDPASLLAALPTPDQIAAKVRRQSIGAVLADICRDLGIAPSHPLWRDLHLAITQYGGNYIRLIMGWFERAFPIAHIAARLRARPEPSQRTGTGPPLDAPA
jgi:hypothetical protein